MDKFRIYMDVDGVLNASVPHPLWFKTEETSASGLAHGYTIHWAPALVERLNEFVASEDVEFVWLTTWCDQAPAVIAPLLGLNADADNSRVLYPLDRRVTFPSIEWKIRALVDDQLKSPSRFAWFEDEIDLNEAMTLRKFEIADRGLLINPGTVFGIQPKHIEAMELFASTEDAVGRSINA